MIFGRSTPPPTPLDGVDVVLADLDGVVYAGPGALPHAVDSLNRAQQEGRRLGYITNNASRTDASVAEHLTSLGLRVAADDVTTSPQAAMRLMRDLVPAGSTLLVIGGEGLVVEVEKAGFVVTRSADDNPAAVVQGFAPEVGWVHLAEAAYALATPVEEGGIPWVATNSDWTIPQARGIAPGNGTLVSAVHTAVGRLATIAGKPERPIFDVAVARTGAQSPLLTGIDRPKQVLAAPPSQRPDYIVEDLRQLFEPYPTTVVKGDRTRVGDAIVEIDGVDLRIVNDGGRQIDLLRAGSAAIWNSGRAIFGFRVPEQLYADPFRVR